MEICNKNVKTCVIEGYYIYWCGKVILMWLKSPSHIPYARDKLQSWSNKVINWSLFRNVNLAESIVLVSASCAEASNFSEVENWFLFTFVHQNITIFVQLTLPLNDNTEHN